MQSLDLWRNRSGGCAHLALLYSLLDLNLWSIPLSYIHFRSLVYKIPTSFVLFGSIWSKGQLLFHVSWHWDLLPFYELFHLVWSLGSQFSSMFTKSLTLKGLAIAIRLARAEASQVVTASAELERGMHIYTGSVSDLEEFEPLPHSLNSSHIPVLFQIQVKGRDPCELVYLPAKLFRA